MPAGLIPSVGTVGDALDNALCENTIRVYETEYYARLQAWEHTGHT